MSAVIQALLRAGGNLFEPRILALLLLPVLGSFVLWAVLTWVFWDAWTGFVAGTLRSTVVAGWLQSWSAVWIIDYTAVLAVLIAVLPAMLVTWFLVQGLFPLSVNEGRYRKPFEGLLIAQLLWLIPRPRLPAGVGLQDHRPESAA